MDAAPSRRSLRRHSNLNIPIAVTAGEPAGIGPDLCLALADTELCSDIVVIADPSVLRARATRLGIDYPEQLQVLPIACPDPDVCPLSLDRSDDTTLPNRFVVETVLLQ